MLINATKNDTIQSTEFDLHFKDSHIDGQFTFLPEYHYHDFHEIYILLEGEVDYYIEDRRYTLQPGNTVILHYHDIHHVLLKDDSAHYIRAFIYFDPTFLTQFSTAKTNLSFCFSEVDNRKSHFIPTKLQDITPFVNRLRLLSSNDEYGNDILLHNTFLELLIFLNKEFLAFKETNISVDNMTENPLIFKAIQFIHNNMSKPIRVTDLAQHLFVSREYLTREFKKNTGFSPHTYITKRKLLYAKELLANGNNSIDIFPICGFQNYSHFINSFKKEFNMTPKQYQNKLQSQLH